MNETLSSVLMDVEQIKSIIPHRFPLLLIENIHEIVYDQKIVASYLIKNDEPVFAGHFPQNPVYPGVYYIESMAQAGAVLIFETLRKKNLHVQPLGFLSTVEKARFRKICGPGDRLIFEVNIEKSRGFFFWLHGKTFLGSDLVAETNLSVALGDKP